MDQPTKELFDQLALRIFEGRCVLFLGAGASKEAGAPLADELAKLIREKYASYKLPATNLRNTVDLLLAQPGADRLDLEEFISGTISQLKPSYGHYALTSYHWSAIFTTNYDRLVEKAYDLVPSPVQHYETATHFEDSVTLGSRDTVTLFKMHGTIDKRTDPRTPIVLSSGDYFKTRENRGHLLDRLRDLQRANTWVFLGYSFDDGQIFELLQELQQKFGTEYVRWSYAVMPSPEPSFAKYLATMKTLVLPLPFNEFFKELESRGKPTPISNPLDELRKSYQAISPSFLSNLDTKLKEINEDYEILRIPKDPKANPHEFYRGNEVTWDDLAQEVDVRRDVQGSIESKIRDDIALERSTTLYLVTSAAGSGKTTLIKRVAYDLHKDIGIPVVRVKKNGKFRPNLLEQIRDTLLAQRVLVLADDAESYAHEMNNLLTHLRGDRQPFTFLAASRKSDWNAYAAEHRIPVNEEIELGETLSGPEIERFLNKLQHHKIIKVDRATPLSYWRTAFERQHDKQILVIMRETVEGGHFDEVILNEFNRLASGIAKDAYRLTSAIHRFNLTIGREHLKRILGVTWDDFFNQIVAPQTERVIIEEYDEGYGRAYYRARHPLIARVLTNIILDSPTKWDDVAVQVTDGLMAGDRIESRFLAKLLMNDEFRKIVSSPDKIREMYHVGRERFPSYSPLLHQLAMFEISVGNVPEAERLLLAGRSAWPNESIFDHSLGVLRVKQSEAQDTTMGSILYLQRAEENFKEAIKKDPCSEYGYHSLATLHLRRARLQENESDKARFIGLAMEVVAAGLQKVPSDKQNWLSDLGAKILQEMGEPEKAIKVLRDGLKTAATVYSYVLLIRLEEDMGNHKEALRLTDEAVEKFPDDPSLFDVQLDLLLRDKNTSSETLLKKTQKAVTCHPDQMEFQFEYACALYEANRIADAKTAFQRAERLCADEGMIFRPRRLHRAFRGKVLVGKVQRIEKRGVWVHSTDINDTIYVRYSPFAVVPEACGGDISFETWFNVKGPLGLQVVTEKGRKPASG